MHSCYKICRVENGKYYSQYGFHFPKWDTEYTIGKYTYAPIGKLFVYLDVAEALKRVDRGWALIKCDVNESIEYVEFGEFEDFAKEDSFPEYWKTRITKTLEVISRSNIALVDYLIPTKVFSPEEVEVLRNILL